MYNDTKFARGLLRMMMHELGFEHEHRKRVLNAFDARPRKKIRFSEARKLVGISDARAWWKRCETDERLAGIEVMRETATSAYCFEDDVNAYLAGEGGKRASNDRSEARGK